MRRSLPPVAPPTFRSLGLHVILVLTATAVAARAAAVIAAELLLERLAAGLGRVLDDVAHPRRGLVDRVARGLDGAADAEVGHALALRRFARRVCHRARDPAGAVDRALGEVGEAVLHVLAQTAHRLALVAGRREQHGQQGAGRHADRGQDERLLLQVADGPPARVARPAGRVAAVVVSGSRRRAAVAVGALAVVRETLGRRAGGGGGLVAPAGVLVGRGRDGAVDPLAERGQRLAHALRQAHHRALRGVDPAVVGVLGLAGGPLHGRAGSLRLVGEVVDRAARLRAVGA